MAVNIGAQQIPSAEPVLRSGFGEDALARAERIAGVLCDLAGRAESILAPVVLYPSDGQSSVRTQEESMPPIYEAIARSHSAMEAAIARIDFLLSNTYL